MLQCRSSELHGYGTAVSSFVAVGGNLSIDNYVGGSYDGVVPGGFGATQGVTVSRTGCSDGETFTTQGTAKGFTQPPIDSLWSHQGYDNNYSKTFGCIWLMKATPSYGFTDGSSFRATCGTLGASSTPEPETWVLMLVGFGGIGAVTRRRARGSSSPDFRTPGLTATPRFHGNRGVRISATTIAVVASRHSINGPLYDLDEREKPLPPRLATGAARRCG